MPMQHGSVSVRLPLHLISSHSGIRTSLRSASVQDTSSDSTASSFVVVSSFGSSFTGSLPHPVIPTANTPAAAIRAALSMFFIIFSSFCFDSLFVTISIQNSFYSGFFRTTVFCGWYWTIMFGLPHRYIIILYQLFRKHSVIFPVSILKIYFPVPGDFLEEIMNERKLVGYWYLRTRFVTKKGRELWFFERKAESFRRKEDFFKTFP